MTEVEDVDVARDRERERRLWEADHHILLVAGIRVIDQHRLVRCQNPGIGGERDAVLR